jgi:hypothetical protein
MESRNPHGFKPGDHVKVTGKGHRDSEKVGVIVKLAGVDDELHGKSRASINCGSTFIFVSLPNLEKL